MAANPSILVHPYDLVIYDLDGVLYVGEDPVPGANDAITAMSRLGVQSCYVTNNASRRTTAVAELLTRLGIPAKPDQVLTSAQASAQLLAEQHPPGTPVLVVGAPALGEEIAAAGLRPVDTADHKPVAVVQGYGPDVGWRHFAEAAVALADGATWVVTNPDLTLPSPRGPLPGNGALVAAVAAGTGRQPDTVVGKPEPGLFTSAVRRCAAQNPLVVGDRLDTDIAGAVRAGYDSVLVFTGVTTPADVLVAAPQERPTYLAGDLNDLLRPYPEAKSQPAGAECGGWEVSLVDGRCRLQGAGEPLNALRALCAAVWSDRSQQPHREPMLAATRDAARALNDLGLRYEVAV